MVDFIKLANNLDKSGDYVSADFLTKISLDLSMLGKYEPYGLGGYGEFKTDFEEEDISDLQNKIGRVPKNIGTKQYYDIGGKVNSALIFEENLALFYIAPYIRANTDINTPAVGHYSSLSSIIYNRVSFTEKMPGVHLRWDEYDFREPTEKSLHKKLTAIGVNWHDSHSGNYLVDEAEYKSRLLILKNRTKYPGDPIYDLSSYCSIVDFGAMQVRRSTEPGIQLSKLKQKIDDELPDNKLAQSLSEAIRWMTNY